MSQRSGMGRGSVLVQVAGIAAVVVVSAGLAAHRGTSARQLAYTGPLDARSVPMSMRMADASFMQSWDSAIPREELLRERDVPVAYCFSAENPPSQQVQAALMAAMQGSAYGGRYNVSNRWSIGNQGDPVTLRWSFAPDGIAWDGGNNVLFSTLDSQFASAGGRATWITQFVNSFARYSALSGLKYTRVTGPNASGNADADDGAGFGTAGSATRGDVRIGMRPQDGANGVLAYNYFPQSGDMVMDASENWANGSNTYRFLRNVVTHEHGHGLGFAHVCPAIGVKLMEPFLNTGFDMLRHDEVRAAQRSYGDIYEPNDSAAAAIAIGAIPVGVSGTVVGAVPSPTISNTATTSIDANADTDWYKFTVAQPSLVTFTITPAGQTYDSSTQNGDSSCNSGNNINTTAMANLTIRLIGTNGVTSIKLGNTAAAGANEIMSDILVDNTGTYYAVVGEGDTPTQSQLYRLTIQALTTTSVTASDSASGQVNLSWTTVPGATSYAVTRNTVNSESGASSLGSTASTTFVDATAVGGTQYYYFVRATQGDAGAPTRLVGSDAGAAASPCPADFNGDGFLDFTDFDAFVAAFEAGTNNADFNNDGFIDFTDFDAYVAAFEAGC
ncbi:MAG: matrixin family metalloprotease [Planctomycetota bacterium]|nr:matrixin family metalloprotease [Planctomycetota bacterium]